MIRILGTIFAGLLGLAFGSFLNVCLSRWPAGESVISPRSHCRNCDHTLGWWENIPVLSWIVLRGRCRNCREPISLRYPLVELATATLWATAAWRSYDTFFPLEYSAGIMFLICTLICLAVLDLEHLWLPDSVTLPGIAFGFFWWFIQGEQVGWALHMPSEPAQDAKNAGERLMGIVVAAGLILLIRWIYWLIRRREGIGLGDAKLMALLAAWLGLPGALLAFGIGVVLGAIVALVLLAVRAARRESESWAVTKLPLGTFLCIGGIIGSLWGRQIIASYLRWTGL